MGENLHKLANRERINIQNTQRAQKLDSKNLIQLIKEQMNWITIRRNTNYSQI
jgi:hypothetical protein